MGLQLMLFSESLRPPRRVLDEEVRRYAFACIVRE